MKLKFTIIFLLFNNIINCMEPSKEELEAASSNLGTQEQFVNQDKNVIANQIAQEIVNQIPEETIIEIAENKTEPVFQLMTTKERILSTLNCCNNALSFRSIVKTITYRITGTLTTAIIALIYTQDLDKALAVGATDLIVKLGVYYLHERIWECIQCGKLKEKNKDLEK